MAKTADINGVVLRVKEVGTAVLSQARRWCLKSPIDEERRARPTGPAAVGAARQGSVPETAGPDRGTPAILPYTRAVTYIQLSSRESNAHAN